jgi:hypothetical protein
MPASIFEHDLGLDLMLEQNGEAIICIAYYSFRSSRIIEIDGSID